MSRAAGVTLLVVLVLLGLGIGCLRYRECRQMGFSAFYCAAG